MMYADDTACAKKINTQFQRLRQHHSKMDKHLNGLTYAVISENEINDWLCGVDHKSPVLLLNTSIYNWENPNWGFINRGLQREIDYNLLTANEGYIEYIKNTFANQWDFVKQFDLSISLYVNDNEKAISIYNKLHKPPEKFTKDEFRTAIEIDLISIFECAETLYLKYDKAYNRYFTKSEFLPKHTTNPDYIQLGYDDNSATALSIIFDDLTTAKLIKCTPDEFAAHFDPFAHKAPDPIKWHGTIMQLLTLFLGHSLKRDAYGPSGYYKMKLNKELDYEEILKHFKLEDKTTGGTLNSNYLNSLDRATIYKSKPIKILIIELNKLLNR
ncbi:hypothetical protein FFF34_003180 [Inquilinus sp. KBS0705]|nr:hypothetical protein FFF34_003180 [Inquilinus sp. KBS0705]